MNPCNPKIAACVLALGLAGCGQNGNTGDDGPGVDEGSEEATADTGDSTGDSTETSDSGPVYDVGDDGTGDTGGQPSCKVGDDMDDAIPECDNAAPPDSFTAEVQWSFAGEDGDVDAVATPLVANLTDDNDDGEIDLCDIPDVVVSIYGYDENQPRAGHIYVLDGETGAVNAKFGEPINGYGGHAIGDIDDDGLPEVVASTESPTDTGDGYLIVFEHDGTIKWHSNMLIDVSGRYPALADLDNDGDVEIVFGAFVFDHQGNHLWSGPWVGDIDVPTAADLDDDGDLEVLHGPSARHHDGTIYYNSAAGIGHSQVADLDDDPQPEVFISGFNGLSLLEHDGTPVYINQTPGGGDRWWRPAAVHDIDGDGEPEILVGEGENYAAYRPDLTVVWSAMVDDFSGYSTGTAFDFLGDGGAEAMYADEQDLFIYDDMGGTLTSSPRRSWTQVEYPVVADADNDQSAEIVVVSNRSDEVPAVQLIRDKEDRWIQARRIWNQHAYHVTNVREDSTIPQFEKPSWELFNTYRTNTQIENGGSCIPPEG
jgi:hypothetical protein